MKNYRCIPPRRWRQIIKSYQSHVVFLHGLIQDYKRDSRYYFDLWFAQLQISDKLRKSLKITSIMLILVSVCLILKIFFF